MPVRRAVNGQAAPGAGPRGRAVPPPPPQEVEGEEVSLGARESYGGGGFIVPEGRYTWSTADVVIYTGTTGTMEETLGTLIHMTDESGKEWDQFWSMGRKAKEAYQPNPVTGKGVMRIPGTPAVKLNDLTNWMMLLDSLWQLGMPDDGSFLNNDVSVLEGLDVLIAHVPEKEERTRIRAANPNPLIEESQQQQGPRMVAVVAEVYNAPWVQRKATTTVRTLNKPTAPAPRGAVRTIAPPPEPEAEAASEISDEDLFSAAFDTFEAVTKKNPRPSKQSLSTASFTFAKTKYGEEMASQIQAFFLETGGEQNLAAALGRLGYKVSGTMVTPA